MYIPECTAAQSDKQNNNSLLLKYDTCNLLKLKIQDYVHSLKTKRYVDYIKHSFEVILI